MSISTEEWKALTESKFWRPEQGKQYQVVLKAWRFEIRKFKGSEVENAEPRPMFVADVTSINGETQSPPKEFSSANKKLNVQLYEAVKFAEKQGRSYLKLAISRLDKNTYTAVDLVVVDYALAGLPPTNTRE